jgi:uncharacterized SAM-binding protein YcdF (DUF218 family)
MTQKWKWGRVVAAFLFTLAIVGSVDFGFFLMRYWQYHALALKGTEQLSVPASENEAIVVLTGDIGRIPRALELLRVRGSAQLLISGAAKGVGLAELVTQQGASTTSLPQIWTKIALESDSTSTLENATFTRAHFKTSPVDRILLVTSDYHMGRSLGIFQREMDRTQIVPFAVPSVLSGKDSLHFIFKIGVEYWKTLLYEISLWPRRIWL